MLFLGTFDTFHNSVSGIHRILELLLLSDIIYTDAIVMCFEFISPHIIEMEELCMQFVPTMLKKSTL